jgi:hypothetical protein
VDLAAEPEKTAVAWLDWSPAGAVIKDLVLGADDDLLIAAITGADKAGIDCPFGWPREFVAFVSAHQTGNVVVPEEIAGKDWRRRLAWRVTDRAVREVIRRDPLSVSADRIGHTAMRCAGLLAKLARHGQPVDRGGSGVVVEVYPALSLHRWGLPYRGYKGPTNLANLSRLVDAFLAAAPWLAAREYHHACRRSDDTFDAVIAAVTARAAALGLTAPPGPTDIAAARSEGWIAIPDPDLSALRP